MAAPKVHTAMASLAAGPTAKPFVARPPMAAPSLVPQRRALVVRATQDKDKSGTDRFVDVFKFTGPAPERINGRLAMVGFVSALAVEAYRGDGVLSQAFNGNGLAWFAGTAALFTVASLVPLFRGESPEDRSDRMGIWTADAEIWNGRAAMVGLIALACTEYLKGAPFINV